MEQVSPENQGLGQQQAVEDVQIVGNENATALVVAGGDATIDQSHHVVNHHHYYGEQAAAMRAEAAPGLDEQCWGEQLPSRGLDALGWQADAWMDCWEAPDVSRFYGRKDELERLEQWILGDRCRLVTLLGMGGMGKSSLAAKLVERVVEHRRQALERLSEADSRPAGVFDFVVWRSLRNAPTVEELLSGVIRVLSRQQALQLPKSLDGLISVVMKYLNQCRGLLVLDNTESILENPKE